MVNAQTPKLANHYTCTGEVNGKPYVVEMDISHNPQNPAQVALRQLDQDGNAVVSGYGVVNGTDLYVALNFENTIGVSHYVIGDNKLVGQWSAYGLDTVEDETCVVSTPSDKPMHMLPQGHPHVGLTVRPRTVA